MNTENDKHHKIDRIDLNLVIMLARSLKQETVAQGYSGHPIYKVKIAMMMQMTEGMIPTVMFPIQ